MFVCMGHLGTMYVGASYTHIVSFVHVTVMKYDVCVCVCVCVWGGGGGCLFVYVRTCVWVRACVRACVYIK